VARAETDRRSRRDVSGGVPAREQGVELVEEVETRLLAQSPGGVVRSNSPATLVEHFKDLAGRLRAEGLLSFDDTTNLAAALFAWLGCVGMAKLLREVDADETPLTDDYRRYVYAGIEKRWEEPGGQWVRYGVTLARRFDLDRIERSGEQRELVEDWVPDDSPYWE
jgi:hypothetical protein